MTKILKSIKDENLTNKVVRILRKYIISENLKEGDKIPTERELSELFNVSRNVIREALKSLEASGILYKVQGKGVFIDSFQSEIIAENIFFGLNKIDSNFKELMEIRKSFEITVLKLLISKISDEEIETLQSILDRAKEKKIKNKIKIDLEFHKKLLEILGNNFIKRLGIIIVESFREISLDIDKNNFEKKLFVRHQKIIDALRKRDVLKAIEAMENHFDKGYRQVKEGGEELK